MEGCCLQRPRGRQAAPLQRVEDEDEFENEDDFGCGYAALGAMQARGYVVLRRSKIEPLSGPSPRGERRLFWIIIFRLHRPNVVLGGV